MWPKQRFPMAGLVAATRAEGYRNSAFRRLNSTKGKKGNVEMNKGYLRILRATTACLAVTICLQSTAYAGSEKVYSYYGKDVTANDIVSRFLSACSEGQDTAACREAGELSRKSGIYPFRTRGIHIRGEEVKQLDSRTADRKAVRISTAERDNRSNRGTEGKRTSSQPDSAGCPRGESSVALPVTFALNSAVLQSEAYTKLRQMALAMKSPALGSCKFAVEGHTDTSGNADFNLRLSKQRAYAVREFLVSMDIDPSRLMPVGKGESEPLAHHDPRAPENRRVQFRIVMN